MWWCSECEREVHPQRVNFHEKHDLCGTLCDSIPNCFVHRDDLEGAEQERDALQERVAELEKDRESAIRLEGDCEIYKKYLGEWLGYFESGNISLLCPIGTYGPFLDLCELTALSCGRAFSRGSVNSAPANAGHCFLDTRGEAETEGK